MAGGGGAQGSGEIYRDVTGNERVVAGRLRAATVDEVVELVRWARDGGETLYPVSTGLNWGYGSALPVRDGSWILDLSGMDRIRNADAISVDHPVAVIEPGVTQGQLRAFLDAHCPDLTFNVTGAARGTSLIGCALDRGVGYYGPRSEDLFGLEVVTGTGEVVHTGFRRLGEAAPLAHTHPHGLGPVLDGLFSQSNLGIVTSACLRLHPRRPRNVAVSLALRRTDRLGALVTVLARLKREGLLTSVMHIGNRARTRATLSFRIREYLEAACGLPAERAAAEAEGALGLVAPGEWAGIAAVAGNPGEVRAVLGEIRRRTRHLARMRVVTEGRLRRGLAVAEVLRFWRPARGCAAALHALRPLHGLTLGRPTDVALTDLLARSGSDSRDPRDLDASDCGLLFVNPALPLDGGTVQRIVAGMEQVAGQHEQTLYMTLNIETATTLVAVVNLLFRRSEPGATERAHACARALHAYLRSEGVMPYRARIDMMDGLGVSDADPYWRTVRGIKGVLDPEGVIAPGRYGPG